MSLAIDVNTVKEVLLADGWHKVKGGSFVLDAYEYIWFETEKGREQQQFQVLHPGGNSGVCATGFSFQEENSDVINGPLTAIIAIKSGKRKGGEQ